MKTIGLVGGLSWISTLDYYRVINETVNQRLGGNEAARIVMYSVNYGDIVRLTHAGDWDSIAALIGAAAKKVEQAGAECLLLCANTMHYIAHRVQAAINIPLLHIADVTAAAITAQRFSTVALLGTRYTMQLPFYTQTLASHGIAAIIPDQAGIDFVSGSIYNELGKGIFLPQTKAGYINIIHQLMAQGAQGVILGCTEIPLLIKPADSPLPVFDTAILHATAAVDFSLGENLKTD